MPNDEKVMITERYLIDIADAIRAKNQRLGETYTPAAMGAAIRAIPAGESTAKIYYEHNNPTYYMAQTGIICTLNGRTYTKVNDLPAYVAYYKRADADFTTPLLVSAQSSAVQYGQAYDSIITNYSTTIIYQDTVYYVAGISYSMDGNRVSTGGFATKLNDTYSSLEDAAEALLNIVYATETPTVFNTNGTKTVPIGYDGWGDIVVDVAGGSGGTILTGISIPSAQVGSNGMIYLKYAAGDSSSLLSDVYLNLNNWTKNSAAFTVFNNTFSDGVNTLIQKGGNGYERIFAPFNCDAHKDYVVIFDYYSPSGVATGYGALLSVKVTNVLNTNGSAQSISYIVNQNLSLAAENDYTRYTISFNSGNNTTLYLVIDLNILDNKQCTLMFKDIFVGEGEPEVAGTINGAYLKVEGAWVNLIGANIEDLA